MLRDKRSSFHEKLMSIAWVSALHVIAIWAFCQQGLVRESQQTTVIFVRFIAPPSPAKDENPKSSPPEKFSEVIPPAVKHFGEVPINAPRVSVEPLQTTDPTPTSSAFENRTVPLSDGPVTLSSELAVNCANRTAPRYPLLSRQMREEGTVILRVELGENGLVDKAEIRQSSGFSRLDTAALAAVKSWQCNPPSSEGQPVRAVALQPFNFELKR